MTSKSSPTEPQPLPARVVVGRVLRPHGLKGDLVVEVLSDVPGRLRSGVELWLVPPDGDAERVRLESVRVHPSGALIRLAGREERGAVEGLRGAELLVEREDVPAPPPGSYYHYELLGCRCHDRREGDLGVVDELVADGGGLLLAIDGPRGRLLVPFAEAFLSGVDVAARRIDLDLPPGLVETCASRS
jgi:16S rRNA processing protein RimM